MSMSLTGAFIESFSQNIGALLEKRRAELLSGRIGKIEGLQVVASRSMLSAKQRSEQDIAAVREALTGVPRRQRHKHHLARRLRRMEDKYAQRCLLGWDWLAAHPEHELHIPDGAPMSATEVRARHDDAIKTFMSYGHVMLEHESVWKLGAPA